MGWFNNLFSKSTKDESHKQKEELTQVTPQEVVTDIYTRLGLTCEMNAEERELVTVIASAIMAGSQTDTTLKIKQVVKIDKQKEIAAVIAAAIAAQNFPESTFRLIAVNEI